MPDSMRLMRLRHLPLLLVFSATASVRAAAQCGQSGPRVPASAPRTIVGLVTDDRNRPIENISIIIAKPKRLSRTNANGEFRIDSLEPGKYPIVVRRIGFEPAEAEVEVKANGGTARICMGEEVTRLAPL